MKMPIELELQLMRRLVTRERQRLEAGHGHRGRYQRRLQRLIQLESLRRTSRPVRLRITA